MWLSLIASLNSAICCSTGQPLSRNGGATTMIRVRWADVSGRVAVVTSPLHSPTLIG